MHEFRPKRLAFRDDYCLACAQPRRSVQIRTFNACHLFWIPVLPLGFWKRWRCTACGRLPHVNSGTRRPFKWLGLVILLISSAAFWYMPVDRNLVIFTWVVRIGAPLGAVLTIDHLLRTPKEQSLQRRLSEIRPATDSACPFCGTQLLMLASECSCPKCGVVRV